MLLNVNAYVYIFYFFSVLLPLKVLFFLFPYKKTQETEQEERTRTRRETTTRITRRLQEITRRESCSSCSFLCAFFTKNKYTTSLHHYQTWSKPRQIAPTTEYNNVRKIFTNLLSNIIVFCCWPIYLWVALLKISQNLHELFLNSEARYYSVYCF